MNKFKQPSLYYLKVQSWSHMAKIVGKSEIAHDK